MQTGPTLRAIGVGCALLLMLFIASQTEFARWPFLWRLTFASVSALAIALPLLCVRQVRQARVTRPSLQLVAVSMLVALGTWLLATCIELSAYLGYPVPPIPDTYPTSLWQVVQLFAVLAVLVPLGSELLFRGAVQRGLEPRGACAALAASTLSFAAYYLYFVRPIGLLPVLLVGLTLGYVAWRSQSLVPSLIVHGAVNALSALVFVLNGVRPDWVADLPLASASSAVVGAAVTGAALWLFARIGPTTGHASPDRISQSGRGRLIIGSLVLLLFSFVLFITLELAAPTAPLSQLTPQQKEAEFRYLTRLVRDTFPLSEATAQVKGLPNVVSLEDEYIRSAAGTKDDWEYYQVFSEYLIRLSHGGHAYVLNPSSAHFYDPWYLSYDYGINRSLLSRVDYWWAMEKRLEGWYAYSSLSILYREGNYVLAAPAVVEGRPLPAGTIVEKVEGLPVDDYVAQQQTRERLQYDSMHRKLFIRWAAQRLLLVDPGKERAGWQVDFRLPDGNGFRGLVLKIPGRNWASVNAPHPNVITMELSEQVGYLRVFSFVFAPGDHAAIQDFMQKSGGRYQKLIIDVRGNGGGDPRYWMDSIVAPLIRQPLTYEVRAAVRRAMLDRLGIRLWLHRIGGIGMFGAQEHFKDIQEIAPPAGFDPENWRVFRVTREILPANTFPFSGRVYVLMDDICASACDDFALTIKTTGIAKLVGIQTLGTTSGVFPPMPYTLPESGISFMLEGDLVFNPDGTIDEMLGTTPDVWLDPVLPLTKYDPNALSQDEWVRWVLAQ